MNKYEVIIGLEIHLQLRTKSKMFCSCANEGENFKVNTNICPICLGHPGTLPTINLMALKKGLAMALAINCKINIKSKFDRKNYFYPDLPKGYQISQFDIPLAEEGYLLIDINNHEKRIGIERLHLEEDAAKNIHKKENTLIDYNRVGIPLIEIVTKPDFRKPEETTEFLQNLRLISKYLNVSNAEMEKGHLRCDANISLRPKGDVKLYPKTEIKNLNSFKMVVKSLKYEIKRQKNLWEKNSAPQISSTRGWNEKEGKTIEQRSKESYADYRYFPEPDLPPLLISDKLLKEVRISLPELPHEKYHRFEEEFGLSKKDIKILISKKFWSEYFEKVISELRAWIFKVNKDKSNWESSKKKLSKLSFSWITGELFFLLKDNFDIRDLKITPENMSELIKLIYNKKINSSAGQTILSKMFKSNSNPSDLAKELDLIQIDNFSELEGLVIKVIMSNSQQVEQYKNGKEALLKFFVGKVMEESRGKANPQRVTDILKEKLT